MKTQFAVICNSHTNHIIFNCRHDAERLQKHLVKSKRSMVEVVEYITWDVKYK